VKQTEPGAVGVLGTGVMATSLARLCAEHGSGVVVWSRTPERAAEAARCLAEEVPGVAVSTDARDLGGCVVVLEATVEELDAKRAALAAIEPLAGPDTLVATTTSSLSITELATALARPERFVGVHFFNPVHRMRLVEVVAGLRTAPEAVERGVAFAEGLGKHPVRVPDRAGFLVNRLLIPYLNQAARLVEEGYASIEDVDMAMQLGAGHPMGPFALIDLIGADVVAAIGRSLHEEFKHLSEAPSPDLLRRIAFGWLGRKTGKGYFEYPEK
jgi:3-hydroxybutyryl-CoA dehydrogenase